VAPLTEDDYSQADDRSDFSKKSGFNGHRSDDIPAAARGTFKNPEPPKLKGSAVKTKSMEDVPLQLNLPLGSDGQVPLSFIFIPAETF
jgi:hypothetical protein